MNLQNLAEELREAASHLLTLAECLERQQTQKDREAVMLGQPKLTIVK